VFVAELVRRVSRPLAAMVVTSGGSLQDRCTPAFVSLKELAQLDTLNSEWTLTIAMQDAKAKKRRTPSLKHLIHKGHHASVASALGSGAGLSLKPSMSGSTAAAAEAPTSTIAKSVSAFVCSPREQMQQRLSSRILALPTKSDQIPMSHSPRTTPDDAIAAITATTVAVAIATPVAGGGGSSVTAQSSRTAPSPPLLPPLPALPLSEDGPGTSQHHREASFGRLRKKSPSPPLLP
jgi:hypothetical protein